MAANRLKVEEGIEAIGNSAISGNLTVTDTLYIGNNNFEFNTNSVSVAADAVTNVDSYNSTNYHFVKYFVTLRDNAGARYHALELIIVNQGANVSMTTYGEVWSDHSLGVIDASVVSGNVVVTVDPVANAAPLTVSTYRTIQA